MMQILIVFDVGEMIYNHYIQIAAADIMISGSVRVIITNVVIMQFRERKTFINLFRF